MAVILQMTYMKKLGLPNFSSHSCAVSLTVEIPDASVAAQESTSFYSLLQTAVDNEIQEVGFMPDATTYGMNNGNRPATNGHPSNGNGNGNGNSHHAAPTPSNGDRWNCTDGQRGFILRIINENNLNKQDVEAQAHQLFGLGVKELNTMQASQLIEELLEKTGQEIRRAASLEPSTRPHMIAPASTAPAPTRGEVISHLQKKVSASRLMLFLQCRLKFFFRYVAGLTKPKTAALHVGTAVHAVLKAWNKARWKNQQLTLKNLHDEFAKAWADVGDDPVRWEAGEEAEEKQTGWRLVETYIRESNIPANSKPEAVELPVEADLHQHGLPTLIGVLDLVQAGKIIDYKTIGQTPNAEKVAHTNEVQTSGYAVLYREATGRRENGIELHHLVKLKNPKLVITALEPMNEHQQTRLFHLMEAYVGGLERRDFIPSPGLQCASCEFFNECRNWH